MFLGKMPQKELNHLIFKFYNSQSTSQKYITLLCSSVPVCGKNWFNYFERSFLINSASCKCMHLKCFFGHSL